MVPGIRTRLLYVEDHADLRDMIAEALGEAGYEVTAVATAEEALDHLQRRGVDVLLTDYNLPGKDGAWLLARATEGGHLAATATVMLTAARDPVAVDGCLLLRKPVDLEVLLDGLAMAVGQLAPDDLPPPESLHPDVELVLYVTAGSQESQKAMRNLHRVLSRFDASRIRLSVVDVATVAQSGSQALDEDRVIVTPTLVKRAPAPRTWIVGSLVRLEPVREMLREALGDPSRGSATEPGSNGVVEPP